MTQPAISDFNLYLIGAGNHQRIYHKLGAHRVASVASRRFAVWAPNAERVNVVGGFNQWNGDTHVRCACGRSRLQTFSENAGGHSQLLRLNLPPLATLFFTGPLA